MIEQVKLCLIDNNDLNMAEVHGTGSVPPWQTEYRHLWSRGTRYVYFSRSVMFRVAQMSCRMGDASAGVTLAGELRPISTWFLVLCGENCLLKKTSSHKVTGMTVLLEIIDLDLVSQGCLCSLVFWNPAAG